MTETEQREYQEEREKKCWMVADMLARFLVENFVADERQAAWDLLQVALSRQMVAHTIGERLDASGEARH